MLQKELEKDKKLTRTYICHILHIIFQLCVKISGCEGEIDEKDIIGDNYDIVFEELGEHFPESVGHLYPLINTTDKNLKYLKVKFKSYFNERL